MVIQPAQPAFAGMLETVVRAIVLASATRLMTPRRSGTSSHGGKLVAMTRRSLDEMWLTLVHGSLGPSALSA